MDSSPSKMNTLASFPPLAGTKRPALLPAFEPASSSPSLPRQVKRIRDKSPERHDYTKYPTPIPTSTTGILSSSPPRLHERPEGRPSLHRTQSTMSERAPLSAVPTVTLPENGEVVRMGRSSNSSDFQLSANRLISRVHVEARYIAASMPLEPNRVEIKCKGWNGVKLHCQGRTWELGREDTFTSETEYADIMLDVQDARVLVAWPDRERKQSIGAQSESSWEEEASPSAAKASARSGRAQLTLSSPLSRNQRVQSPQSPTPAGIALPKSLADLFSDDAEPEAAVVQVYEDSPSPENDENNPEIAAGISMSSTVAATSFYHNLKASQSSELSEADDEDAEHDPDEENDPIVHSFGPFGSNLTNKMAVFTAGSPQKPRRQLSPILDTRSSSEEVSEHDAVPIVNHVVNQLAYSRLSSTPLSVIMSHLPAELKGTDAAATTTRPLSKSELRIMLKAAACVGEIHREGKDAAGKPLESEYYYVPDHDDDAARRAAVVDTMRKPSLRNCRKQHKVCHFT